MSIIKLKSSDGKIFEVDAKIAKCSGTIKAILEDSGIDGDDDDAIVPLPNVNSTSLRMILQWAQHHIDDRTLLTGTDGTDKEKCIENISLWYENFLKRDQDTLFDLILAANYLDTKELLDMACKTVANMIRGKTTEELRKIFHFTNDFNAEEEQQLVEENEWFEEANMDSDCV